MNDLTDLQRHAKMALAQEACEAPIAAMMDAIMENAASAGHDDRLDYVGDVWSAVCFAFQMMVCESFERIPEFRTCHRPENFTGWYDALRDCTNAHVANGGCRRSKDK